MSKLIIEMEMPIKGEISEIELMHLEEERAFAARNIAAERKDDEQDRD